jgi:hypothetical protein
MAQDALKYPRKVDRVRIRVVGSGGRRHVCHRHAAWREGMEHAYPVGTRARKTNSVPGKGFHADGALETVNGTMNGAGGCVGYFVACDDLLVVASSSLRRDSSQFNRDRGAALQNE